MTDLAVRQVTPREREEQLTIHVTFPERFTTPTRFAGTGMNLLASSIFTDPGQVAMMSDADLKTAVARHIEEVRDLATGEVDISSLFVSRPATGNIAIMAKASYGR